MRDNSEVEIGSYAGFESLFGGRLVIIDDLLPVAPRRWRLLARWKARRREAQVKAAWARVAACTVRVEAP